MKKVILLVAATAALCSCASVHKSVVKDASLLNLSPSANVTTTLADLNVSETKVTGDWTAPAGSTYVTEKVAKDGAVANALAKSDSDVLVAPIFTVEYSDAIISKVSVTGYPAKYGNFRAFEPVKCNPENCKRGHKTPAVVIYNNSAEVQK